MLLFERSAEQDREDGIVPTLENALIPDIAGSVYFDTMEPHKRSSIDFGGNFGGTKLNNHSNGCESYPAPLTDRLHQKSRGFLPKPQPLDYALRRDPGPPNNELSRHQSNGVADGDGVLWCLPRSEQENLGLDQQHHINDRWTESQWPFEARGRPNMNDLSAIPEADEQSRTHRTGHVQTPPLLPAPLVRPPSRSHSCSSSSSRPPTPHPGLANVRRSSLGRAGKSDSPIFPFDHRLRRASSSSMWSSSVPSPSPSPMLSDADPSTHGIAAFEVAGLLPTDHRPARGRGRSRQLDSMTAQQIEAEAEARLEKNRQTARESRRRRKMQIQVLQQEVEMLRSREQESQNIIAALREELSKSRRVPQASAEVTH